MCKALKVSRSGYYKWMKKIPSAREVKHNIMKEAIKKSHKASRKTAGYRKVHEDLVDNHKILCDKETVRVLMSDLGLYSVAKKKFKVTTESGHNLPVAPNILNRNFESEAPNKKWVTDITYIRTLEGWLFLAIVLDLFSRKIVGWATSSRIDEALVSAALKDAVKKRKPGAGLLHHSDRGVQYASENYQKLLAELSMVCSMSRKGNCWDNAVAESFFGKFKTEWVRGKVYLTRDQAQRDIFEYIELFYNIRRRHASLGYLSPLEYETRLQVRVV
jgi:transposase InsO family protein